VVAALQGLPVVDAITPMTASGRACPTASKPRSTRTAGAIELVRRIRGSNFRLPDALHDAAKYIQKFPKATQQLPHWQAAAEALILAAEDRGPLLHARVGMLRAMNHGVERVFRSDRKETP
jgi:hypothetical protein